MRFSKKLLTALLPIAATSALVPVLTSCNKGSAWDFSFGDSINCISNSEELKTIATYHSLSDVQNAVKNHVAIDSLKEIAASDLPTWNNGSIVRQTMYFDFIASNVFTMKINGEDRKPISIALKCTIDDTSYEFKLYYKNSDSEVVKEVGEPGVKFAYTNKSGVAYIQMLDEDGDPAYETKSYMFQNTTVK